MRAFSFAALFFALSVAAAPADFTTDDVAIAPSPDIENPFPIGFEFCIGKAIVENKAWKCFNKYVPLFVFVRTLELIPHRFSPGIPKSRLNASAPSAYIILISYSPIH